MQFIPPRLSKDRHNRYSVVFYVQGKRYRVSNGKKFGVDLHPNKEPFERRLIVAQELQLRIHQALHDGWGQQPTTEMTFQQAVEGFAFKKAVKPTYQLAFDRTRNRLLDYLTTSRSGKVRLSQITSKDCLGFLHSKAFTAASFNTERKHMSSLLSDVLKPLGVSNPVEAISPMKETPALHKPFDDVQAVLAEIRQYNENLWLCCLLTYGCLLRPHQEIRQLTWGDFSEDMSFISLSGRRNKSGRNRIVPLNPQISVHLQRGGHTDNIFTGCETPYNPDYFKTLWGKYRKRSQLLQPNQTLYSFRHSGAIEIYKRTGSLTVLQQAMGHASLAVSLGYLRNLEVPMLKVEDMPTLLFDGKEAEPEKPKD